MGAVLEQEAVGKSPMERRPIFYWSSIFRDYEKNYSISEKEALACVSAINKFRIYLFGREFILRTDHRALVTLLAQTGSKRVETRTERWRQKISIFNYKVEFIWGTDNMMADWLFRSTSSVDHEEAPLMEEYVVNEVKKRLDGSPFEYDQERRKYSER